MNAAPRSKWRRWTLARERASVSVTGDNLRRRPCPGASLPRAFGQYPAALPALPQTEGGKTCRSSPTPRRHCSLPPRDARPDVLPVLEALFILLGALSCWWKERCSLSSERKACSGSSERSSALAALFLLVANCADRRGAGAGTGLRPAANRRLYASAGRRGHNREGRRSGTSLEMLVSDVLRGDASGSPRVSQAYDSGRERLVAWQRLLDTELSGPAEFLNCLRPITIDLACGKPEAVVLFKAAMVSDREQPVIRLVRSGPLAAKSAGTDRGGR